MSVVDVDTSQYPFVGVGLPCWSPSAPPAVASSSQSTTPEYDVISTAIAATNLQ